MRLLHQKEYPDYKYRPKKRTRSGSDMSGGIRVKQEKEEGLVSNKRMHREENHIEADFQFKREPQAFASINTSPDSPRYTFPSNQAFRCVRELIPYTKITLSHSKPARDRKNSKCTFSAPRSMECMT